MKKIIQNRLFSDFIKLFSNFTELYPLLKFYSRLTTTTSTSLSVEQMPPSVSICVNTSQTKPLLKISAIAT